MQNVLLDLGYELPGVGDTRNIKSLPWGHPGRVFFFSQHRDQFIVSSTSLAAWRFSKPRVVLGVRWAQRLMVRWQHSAPPTAHIKNLSSVRNVILVLIRIVWC